MPRHIKGETWSWIYCETSGCNFNSCFISIWVMFGTNGECQREGQRGEDCYNYVKVMQSWLVGQSPRFEMIHLVQLKEQKNCAMSPLDTHINGNFGVCLWPTGEMRITQSCSALNCLSFESFFLLIFSLSWLAWQCLRLQSIWSKTTANDWGRPILTLMLKYVCWMRVNYSKVY